MTDIMTSQNTELSSWDILYIGEKLSRKVKGILYPIFSSRKRYISRSSEIISNNCATVPPSSATDYSSLIYI